MIYDMEINVLIDEEFKKKVSQRFLWETTGRILAMENTDDNVEIGIFITTQDNIKKLNWNYRDKNEPTDVLSFYMIEESSKGTKKGFVTPPDEVRHLGEVIISYPQAVIQARENKHTLRKEITVLLVHGILHLLGYDHEIPADEKRMKPREEEILSHLEI